MAAWWDDDKHDDQDDLKFYGFVFFLAICTMTVVFLIVV
jgi:hypothetical protein